MGAVVRIKPELRSWIEHNLDRGCPPEQLIEGMIAQRFDPPVAQGLVRAFVDARSAGVPMTADTVRIDMPTQAGVNDPPRMTAGHSIVTADRIVSVVARLSRPIIAVLSNVLSAGECEQLIALARPRLKPSTVVDPVTGEDRVAEHRNSEGMFFHLGESPFIAALDARFSRIMNLPIGHGEGLQVLRYGPGTHSTPHFDFLVPRNPASEASLRRSGQRVSSLVAYLNDVPGGGETTFPHAGLSVCPRRGNAVYFEYCNSRSQVDAASLHAGAPVTEGEKWAVTKWMRERPFVSAAAAGS
ncbi:MAG TPA: 2OG-Fe(II) oxygenase [Steroidobacteraceae bacterium]|nr:2OG-Fe(II) oxygenase [Steroidobacteraceae bacterium]